MNIHWLSLRLAMAIHQEQINEHGGANGLRDKGLLESALMSPQNQYYYNKIIDIPSLASSYTFSIVKNHPFIDGNKRTGFIAGVTFLMLNGYQFTASEIEVVNIIQALASSTITEEELQKWFIAESKQIKNKE
ncbi:MAG: type II toxin-antitoxin system death-on-curing family toxin [Cyanobacteria bacterium]|nr:type II toxin-antitoxin system death-on-curing family toxin [Cyanobacteria bacterium CG_2015-16_32_12]NCO76696.1 type II toxin-antitoxin system death-on-curing family toxin [Cyanobacteria bacterium CG_2015-22_32_23]NCQ43149.1 type II toxin-antitoxin system death-on-curing family toxin [Cyanobacteria bacterium CG_2015-04_32_10]